MTSHGGATDQHGHRQGRAACRRHPTSASGPRLGAHVNQSRGGRRTRPPRDAFSTSPAKKRRHDPVSRPRRFYAFRVSRCPRRMACDGSPSDRRWTLSPTRPTRSRRTPHGHRLSGSTLHRAQITYDALNTASVRRPEHRERGGGDRPDRATLRTFLRRWAGEDVAAAVETTTDWRFVVEELQRASATVQLAEPADTTAARGRSG